MQRRWFMRLLGAAAFAWPYAARAQQPKKIPRIGVLWHAGNAEEEEVYLTALRKGFRDLGYVEGKNIQLENRFPDEKPERFRTLARELVDSKVDVIIAVAGIGAKEVKQFTDTIPIVIATDPDPVGNGLVQSLARPGGNVTGLSLMIVDLSDKRLSLFRELVPNLSRVAILVGARDAFSTRILAGYEKSAKAAGLSTQVIEVANRNQIDRAFEAVAQARFDGAALVGPMLLNERVQVGESALAHRIPTLSGIAEMAQRGVLLSYGQDIPDYMRKAAGYVDKILKGAKPGDLPVEQPTRFKLVINLKTANTLGVIVPPTLLATADEVIE
jgi:putative ABC transport system substrate-binding protein